jgi:hypothetical protein
MDMFKALKNKPIDRSGAGGFGRRPSSSRSALSSGAFANGNPQIDINYNLSPTLANEPVFIRQDGLTVLHELFHVAGNGADHWQMLVAAYAVAGQLGLSLGRRPASTDPARGTADPNDKDGMEFDSYLWNACK